MLPTMFALMLQGTLPPPEPRDLFDLLEGEWICRQAMLAGGPVYRRESWYSREDGDTGGAIRSFPPGRSGTERPPEFRLFYLRGRHSPRLMLETGGRDRIRYRLARATMREAVFEALGNGSPRIISYRLTDGQRLDVMHGLADGSSRRWTFRQPGAGRPVIGCNGNS